MSGFVSFRQSVRTNVVAILKAANTSAAANVQSNRAGDTDTADMPFLGVYMGHEAKSLVSTAGTDTLLDSTMTINVDVRVSSLRQPAAENALDVLLDQVQAALFTTPAFWMAQPNGSRLIRRVNRVEIHAAIKTDANAYVGMGQVVIDVEYSDAFATVIPDTFETLDITINPNAAPPPPPAAPLPVTVNIEMLAQ